MCLEQVLNGQDLVKTVGLCRGGYKLVQVCMIKIISQSCNSSANKLLIVTYYGYSTQYNIDACDHEPEERIKHEYNL